MTLPSDSSSKTSIHESQRKLQANPKERRFDSKPVTYLLQVRLAHRLTRGLQVCQRHFEFAVQPFEVVLNRLPVRMHAIDPDLNEDFFLELRHLFCVSFVGPIAAPPV